MFGLVSTAALSCGQEERHSGHYADGDDDDDDDDGDDDDDAH